MNLVCSLFRIIDAARLIAVSDEDENAFSEHHENKNTIKKTLYDLKKFSRNSLCVNLFNSCKRVLDPYQYLGNGPPTPSLTKN